MSDDTSAIALAETVLRLLEQANFSTTYKYALFTAILDLCVGHMAAKDHAPTTVTTRQLAEKVVELYWPHTNSYLAGPAPDKPLRQGGGRGAGQAEILSQIRQLREDTKQHLLFRVCTNFAKDYERVVRQVEWKLIEMPIPRLQCFGREENRFLYDYHWTRSIRQGEVSAYQRGQPSSFDSRLVLRPDVGDHLVRLNGVLRPLLRREWAGMVARMNNLDESRLEDFLFGVDRASLEAVRGPLRELQDGECFYCCERVQGPADVDHFVPWSLCYDNGLDNLVVAHPRCNNSKSNFLAAAEHVERWSERARRDNAKLNSIAGDLCWDRAPERSRSVAFAAYRNITADSRLWCRSDEFVPAEVPRIRAALEAALVA